MTPRAAAALLAPLLAGVAPGCGESGPAPLVVVTTLDGPGRERAASLYSGGGGLVPVRWVVAGAGDDLAALARGRRADVILGGPAWAHALWAEGNSVARDAGEVPIRSAIGGRRVQLDDNRGWGDPRIDPLLAGWALRELGEAGGWGERFPQLALRVASAPEALEPARLEAAEGVAADWIDGASATAWARQPGEARRFVEAVGDGTSGGFDPAEGRTALIAADLLGALLTDAGDELREAWPRLARELGEEEAAKRLGGLPTWPPESVRAVARAHPDDAESWLGTLAESMTDDDPAATWLISQWMGNPRPVDLAVVREIAGAVGGRLVAEPRFRSWLRGEWAAWARMRYRLGSSVPGEP